MTPPKPLRADARRNRARVLDAAEALFAQKGATASTEDVAKAAGVGIGTVFRHFPTKEALLEAVYLNRLQRLAEEADALSRTEDEGAAFFAFFTRAVEQSATKIALADALTSAGIDSTTVAADISQVLREAMGTLLKRAQDTGAVRADIGLADLSALLIGASRAAEHSPATTARTLTVIIDGMRAGQRS
jgi:AcrR family transcriptional regulator